MFCCWHRDCDNPDLCSCGLVLIGHVGCDGWYEAQRHIVSDGPAQRCRSQSLAASLPVSFHWSQATLPGVRKIVIVHELSQRFLVVFDTHFIDGHIHIRKQWDDARISTVRARTGKREQREWMQVDLFGHTTTMLLHRGQNERLDCIG